MTVEDATRLNNYHSPTQVWYTKVPSSSCWGCKTIPNKNFKFGRCKSMNDPIKHDLFWKMSYDSNANIYASFIVEWTGLLLFLAKFSECKQTSSGISSKNLSENSGQLLGGDPQVRMVGYQYLAAPVRLLRAIASPKNCAELFFHRVGNATGISRSDRLDRGKQRVMKRPPREWRRRWQSESGSMQNPHVVVCEGIISAIDILQMQSP